MAYNAGAHRFRSYFRGAYVLAGGLPDLPDSQFNYYDYAVTDLPRHFTVGGQSVVSRDNTPDDNQITDAGATLGRVLFYDARLSHNNSTACASCHVQETGFADPNQFSIGFDGEETPRHSMALTNTKFYESGRMFWDERATSVEHQALLPIQDPVEMGMDLDDLTDKLQRTAFYDELFTDAFGDSEVSSERISLAIAQFVRSMVSYQSEFDEAFAGGTRLNDDMLSAAAQRGHETFSDNCAGCHGTNAQISTRTANNGLDLVTTDEGAGDGEFKAPSLRNVEVRAGFMHDGRFSTLREVIEFYNSGIQANRDLDRRLERNGQPIRMNLSESDLDDLEAFLNTLTDDWFLTAEMFSNPFGDACDFDQDGNCDIEDLDQMLGTGSLVEGVAVDSSGNEVYDLNGDSTIDDGDLNLWLAAATEIGDTTLLPGDANLDGAVNFADFLSLSANFGSDAGWAGGDFDGDGIVAFADFLQLTNNFGETSVAAVPEPTAACLVAVGLLTLSCRRKRRSFA